MSKRWMDEEQYCLIEALLEYRRKIKGFELNEAIKLTKDFAAELHQSTPALQDRSLVAIEQRLPYLDNLLGGTFNKGDYASKDQHLFGTKPRTTGSKEPNLCNTRHSYKGALKKYLNQKVKV
jgi:hypothetical protein